MKKERIVGLCICVVLLASLQSLFFIAAGLKQFRFPARSSTGISLRSNVLPALVYAGWPPLGFLYGELQLLHKRMEGSSTQDSILQAGKDQAGRKELKQLADRGKPDRKVETVRPPYRR